uniref:Senecionine N-oxygenase n=1 Tax=Tyria jacobaeae TaxID=179666 RepID=SNO1_TYRJA|nr:RecName: Full=Senecionine N-oxygenase; Short=SNO; Flags: Precursor [Tyria jacobaeae]CAD12369.1 senecionine N-oxygenase [Tyria jacobaeae]
MFRKFVIMLVLSLLVAAGISQASSASRVCIIGAGYSGLATARYLQDYGLNYTIFEATPNIGGTWRYDPRVGTDEDGIPIYSSNYKNLRVNSPVDLMTYHGYEFQEGTRSFISGNCFYKYMKSFVRHFGLMENIQVRSLVTWVQRTEDKWNLTYMKTDTRKNYTEECDFVVVASGEFSTPKIPHIKGQEEYKGKTMHSHDYKEAESFRGQRVLVIGAGPSGLDVVMQLSNITSKLVHSQHILKSWHIFNQPDFPGNFISKPNVKHFTANGAVFEDDTVEEFDMVIYCTGFYYNHPFLSTLSSGITATENYVMPLYQQVVNINQPTMTFVGICKPFFAKLLDQQAHYSAKLAAGHFKLPSQDKMLRHWLEHVQMLREAQFKITDVNSVGPNVDEYFKALHKEAGVPLLPPVYASVFVFSGKTLLEDLQNYREYDYRIISDTQFKKKYNPREEVCPYDD